MPATPAELTSEKKALRRAVLARRARLGGPVRARAALTRCLGLRHDWRGVRVGIYLGFGHELDPMPLVRELVRRGAVVGLPVVVRNRRPLVFRRFLPNVLLQHSDFGIAEPDHRARPVRPDIVLAPLVGIDRSGMRLGYGGGFYDRTIMSWWARGHRPELIGLAFECQVVDRLPAGRHDIRLHGLVTEAAVRRFA